MSRLPLKRNHSANIYVKFRPEVKDTKSVFDFTEKKLLKLILVSEDKDEKNIFINMLKDYMNGRIAIHWDNGIPIITKCIRG